MSKSEVLFDKGSTDALLTLAAHEDLLYEKKYNGSDGIFQNILQRNIFNWHKEHILTQITLSSNVITLSNLPDKFLTGKILEEDIIRKKEYNKLFDVTAHTISSDIITALLKARGIDTSIEEFQTKFQYAKECFDEHEQHFKKRGIKPPNLGDEIAAIVFRGHKNYSKKDFEIETRFKEAYRMVEPIMDVTEEYAKLTEVSSDTGALLGTPSIPSTFVALKSPFYIDNRIESSQELRLLRITSDFLGCLPRGNTIKESIALSKEQATIDLRLRLQDWISELKKGTLNEIEIIQRDIIKAKASLKDVQRNDKIGTIVTWLSVPISFIEFFTGIPPILGISASVVGSFVNKKSNIKKLQNQWISFNSWNH